MVTEGLLQRLWALKMPHLEITDAVLVIRLRDDGELQLFRQCPECGGLHEPNRSRDLDSYFRCRLQGKALVEEATDNRSGWACHLEQFAQLRVVFSNGEQSCIRCRNQHVISTLRDERGYRLIKALGVRARQTFKITESGGPYARCRRGNGRKIDRYLVAVKATRDRNRNARLDPQD